MANPNPTHVVTGVARLSYANLTRPYGRDGQEPKYSTTVLVPKADVATKQRLDAAIEAAIQAGVSSKWGGQRPPMLAVPVHDGDGNRPSDGAPFGDECKGHWVFTAKSDSKPEIVDVNLNPVINETEVYSGMYAHVSVDFFPYNSNGRKGVGCGLGNVMKVSNGEPLAGRTSAAEDFANVATGAPATVQQPPAYGQQPPAYGQQPPAYGQQPAPQTWQGVNPVTGAPYGGQ